MFAGLSDGVFTEILDGISIKTLVHGAGTLMTEFRLRRASILPEHQHPQEQTGYLVTGRILLRIGGQSREMTPGDSWCIAGNVPHGAEILEDSVALEVFAPLREDYLKYHAEKR
jgi:quercetin dioxygenase-like cupin family protein